jgi:hypothetical protein
MTRCAGNGLRQTAFIAYIRRLGIGATSTIKLVGRAGLGTSEVAGLEALGKTRIDGCQWHESSSSLAILAQKPRQAPRMLTAGQTIASR